MFCTNNKNHNNHIMIDFKLVTSQLVTFITFERYYMLADKNG
jgi:hypothetical protein